MKVSLPPRIYQLMGLYLGVGLLFLLAMGPWHARLDLTQDQRYSLHDATKKLLRGLDEALHIEIYLTGALPMNLSS